jgi:hypothetical protein
MNAALSALTALLISCLLPAAEPLIELNAWPAIIYADEAHRVAFRLDAPVAGELTVGWDGVDGQVFAVPAGISAGLLPLPQGSGRHAGAARLGERAEAFAVRLAEAAEPWPITGLRHGLPIDAAGVPVVLVEHRRSANDLRRARLAPTVLPRPTDRAILVGDPLAALGGDAWSDLDADLRPAIDERYPQHAALAALANLAAGVRPRSILWSPGNGALFAGTWAGEARLCQVVAWRCTALAIRPRLVLVLPPSPVTTAWREAAERRRQDLVTTAQAAGWELCDLAAVAGDPAVANRVNPGLYAEYPVGAAQERIRAALRDELRR